MKSTFRAAVAAFVAAFSTLSLHSFASPITIMPIGDSITVGVDYATSTSGGYRDYLYQDLTAAGISFTFTGVNTAGATPLLTSAAQVHHNGYGGYTVEDIDANISGSAAPVHGGDGNLGGYWLTSGSAGGAPVMPTIILLQIGTNDFIEANQAVGTTETNLEKLVSDIHAITPNTIILIAGIPPFANNTTFNSDASTFNARIAQYDAWISGTLVTSSTFSSYTRYVDNYTAFYDISGADGFSPFEGDDNVHPTRYGYPVLAAKWSAAIEALEGVSPTLYSVTPSSATVNGSASGSYPAGSIVSLVSNAPSSGNQFDVWSPATTAMDNPLNSVVTYKVPASTSSPMATYDGTNSTILASGTYQFESDPSNLQLGQVENNWLAASGTAVSGSSIAQNWVVTPLASVNGTNNVVEISVPATGRALGIVASSTNVNAYCTVGAFTGALSQEWEVLSYPLPGAGYTVAEDVFELVNLNSGQAIYYSPYIPTWLQGTANNIGNNDPELLAIFPVATVGGGGNAPAAPTGLSATAGNAQVGLSWTASSGAASYDVYRGTSSGGESATPIATGIISTSCTDSSVTNGTTYYYYVSAVNSSGTSAYSNQASATPASGGTAPAAPTGLSATAGNTQVGLSWTASSGAVSYDVYRGTSSGGESSTPVAAGVTATSCTDTGLTNGTTYYYKVAAVNSSGTSAVSNEASATPVAPAASQITWGAALNMTGNTDVANNGIAFDAVCFYSTALTVNSVTFNSLASGGNPRTDGTISVSYGDNVGDYTSPFTTNMPSSVAYSDLVNTGAYGEDTGTVTISGLTVGDNYQVEAWAYYSADGSSKTTYSGATPVSLINSTGQFSVGTFIASSTSISFTYTTTAGHDFVNAVSVRNITGDSVPQAPGNLQASAGNALAVLSWAASSGATSYNVYRGTASGGESTAPIAKDLTTLSYTDTLLTNGVTYYYTVTASNSFGMSAHSTEVSATPSGAAANEITWGAAQTMKGDSDVSTSGTYFDAISFYDLPLQVNGVTFNSLAAGSNPRTDGEITVAYGDNVGDFSTAFTTAPPSSLSYSAMVNAGAYGESSSTVLISGLTVGHSYQIQSWSYFSADGSATTTYSGATPVTLTNSVGQFATGTFSANSTVQSYTYSTGGGHNFVNAISVRDITSLTGMTYSQWVTNHFGSSSPASAESATPENDGVTNLLKYLCDINPTTEMSASEWEALPVAGTIAIGGSTYLTLTYRLNPLATGLSVASQVSSDLQTWQTVTPADIVTTGTDPATGDRILRYQIPAGPGPAFARLSVTGP